jgi:hypothetical protein
MQPIQMVTISAMMTYGLSSRVQRSAGRRPEVSRIRPPIVGVVAFPLCESGVPCLTPCWIFIVRSQRMIGGPTRNENRSAVTAAPAPRNAR